MDSKNDETVFENNNDPVSNREKYKDIVNDLDIILENMPGALFVHDLDGNFILVNKKTEEYTGYSREELLEMNVSDLDPETVSRHDRENIWQNLRHGELQKIRVKHKRKDGTYYNADISINSILYKDNPLLFAIGQNIEKEIKLEKRLIRSEEKYRTIFENATLGVFTSTIDGKFLTVNPALARMLGYETPDEVRKNITNIAEQIYVKTAKRAAIINNQTDNSSTEHYVNHYKRKNGEEWIANLYLKTLVDPDTGKEYFEGVVEDITDRIRKEEKINQLLKDKEILLHEVHHRIKNNMNTIQSLLKLNATSLKDDLCKKVLLDASGRINSMQVLYDKLYRSNNFSNIPGKPYLESLIPEIIQNFPNNNSIELIIYISTFTLANNSLFYLGLILNELITNSMKYAFDSDNGVIDIKITSSGDEINFIYKDNGKGLPENIDFNTTDSFGLALIRMLSGNFKGNFSMHSNLNGVEYNLSIPL